MAEKFDNLDWFICGRGFVFKKENIDDDREAAREGFQLVSRFNLESMSMMTTRSTATLTLAMPFTTLPPLWATSQAHVY